MILKECIKQNYFNCGKNGLAQAGDNGMLQVDVCNSLSVSLECQ